MIDINNTNINLSIGLKSKEDVSLRTQAKAELENKKMIQKIDELHLKLNVDDTKKLLVTRNMVKDTFIAIQSLSKNSDENIFKDIKFEDLIYYQSKIFMPKQSVNESVNNFSKRAKTYINTLMCYKLILDEIKNINTLFSGNNDIKISGCEKLLESAVSSLKRYNDIFNYSPNDLLNSLLDIRKKALIINKLSMRINDIKEIMLLDSSTYKNINAKIKISWKDGKTTLIC